MGFGALLHIGCDTLDLTLCLKLVGAFDTRSKMLSFRGVAVRITPEDVGAILGIPCGGKPISPIVQDHDQLNKIKKEQLQATHWTDLESIIGGESSGREFHRAFLLYALGILLCPTSSTRISNKLLSATVDAKNDAHYN